MASLQTGVAQSAEQIDGPPSRQDLAMVQQMLQHSYTLQQELQREVEALKQQLAHCSSSPSSASGTLCRLVHQPETTDGKSATPMSFVESFEFFAASMGLDMGTSQPVNIAATYLRGAAADWYKQHMLEVQAGHAAVFTCWQQFVEAFIRRFSPGDPQERARHRLDTCRQTGSAAAFASTYNTIMLQLPHMDEADRVHNFTMRLKPAVRLQVEMSHPSTLNDAITAAITVDTLMFRGGGSAGSNYGGSGSHTGSKPPSSGAPRGQATPMELGSSEAGGSSGRPYCRYCRRPGHYTRDCKRHQGSKPPQRGQAVTGTH